MANAHLVAPCTSTALAIRHRVSQLDSDLEFHLYFNSRLSRDFKTAKFRTYNEYLFAILSEFWALVPCDTQCHIVQFLGTVGLLRRRIIPFHTRLECEQQKQLADASRRAIMHRFSTANNDEAYAKTKDRINGSHSWPFFARPNFTADFILDTASLLVANSATTDTTHDLLIASKSYLSSVMFVRRLYEQSPADELTAVNSPVCDTSLVTEQFCMSYFPSPVVLGFFEFISSVLFTASTPFVKADVKPSPAKDGVASQIKLTGDVVIPLMERLAVPADSLSALVKADINLLRMGLFMEQARYFIFTQCRYNSDLLTLKPDSISKTALDAERVKIACKYSCLLRYSLRFVTFFYSLFEMVATDNAITIRYSPSMALCQSDASDDSALNAEYSKSCSMDYHLFAKMADKSCRILNQYKVVAAELAAATVARMCLECAGYLCRAFNADRYLSSLLSDCIYQQFFKDMKKASSFAIEQRVGLLIQLGLPPACHNHVMLFSKPKTAKFKPPYQLDNSIFTEFVLSSSEHFCDLVRVCGLLRAKYPVRDIIRPFYGDSLCEEASHLGTVFSAMQFIDTLSAIKQCDSMRHHKTVLSLLVTTQDALADNIYRQNNGLLRSLQSFIDSLNNSGMKVVCLLMSAEVHYLAKFILAYVIHAMLLKAPSLHDDFLQYSLRFTLASILNRCRILRSLQQADFVANVESEFTAFGLQGLAAPFAPLVHSFVVSQMQTPLIINAGAAPSVTRRIFRLDEQAFPAFKCVLRGESIFLVSSQALSQSKLSPEVKRVILSELVNSPSNSFLLASETDWWMCSFVISIENHEEEYTLSLFEIFILDRLMLASVSDQSLSTEFCTVFALASDAVSLYEKAVALVRSSEYFLHAVS